MNSLEIFSGVGGLSLGLSRAGFRPRALIDNDVHANNTLIKNNACKDVGVRSWPVIQSDIRDVDLSKFSGDIDLLAAGPPCQPFSFGGKHQSLDDPRDMFPEVVRAIRVTRPRAFLIENVKGLTRKTWRNYLSYIVSQLSFPELMKKPRENWEQHLRRLEKYKTSRRTKGLEYNVVYRVLNAADFGVPQRRERIFLVGFRSDIDARWNFPQATHSENSLLHDQFISLDYWERHQVVKSQRPEIPKRYLKRVEALTENGMQGKELPWITVRDAIGDLPEPSNVLSELEFSNHVYRAGARIYRGHCGSKIDQPSKTLKAGRNGVPGGENMFVSLDGQPRYYTIRESARLQTFPDEFLFQGTWTQITKELGNAVPVLLAEQLARSMVTALTRKPVS